MYNLILFDIDGVLLSEERYFDASALTVYELLNSPQYLGIKIENAPVQADWFDEAGRPAISEQAISDIRRFVFADDHVLDFMKARGVNANWDMVYLQFGYQLAVAVSHEENRRAIQDLLQESSETIAIGLQKLGSTLRQRGFALSWNDFSSHYHQCEDKHALFAALKADFELLAGVPADEVDSFADRLWDLGQHAFQDWYLGQAYRDTETAKGKQGFLDNEVPLADVGELKQVLTGFRDQGVELGIATGRPETETYVPLRLLGLIDSFEADRISTASDVLVAQSEVKGAPPLSKPHPFSYLRSYLRSPDAETVLDHALPLPGETAHSVLVVGDSVADWMAAHAIGCDFAAVLTGLSGQDARAQFESLGCTYIWDNVLAVKTLL